MSNITINAAAPYQNYTVAPGDSITLNFATDSASFQRVDNALVLTFEEGATIKVDNFFVAGQSQQLPQLVLDNGDIVNGKDFLLALDPNFNISLAAGPASSASSSSGAGSYDDNTGTLMGGVDTLNSLGTSYWARSTNAPEFLLQNTFAQNGATPPLGETPGGENPGGETPQTPSYHTRLVISNTAQNTFSFYAVDASGNIITDASLISVSFANNPQYFTAPTIDSNGKITLSLTAEGLAMLGNNSVSDLLIISVNGNSYPMPLIITNTDSYDAETEETLSQVPGQLLAEWYSSDGKMILGESITLGGSALNVINVTNHGDASYTFASLNNSINTASADEASISITTSASNGAAYAMGAWNPTATDLTEASIIGGNNSSISLKATADAGAAIGLLAQGNTGAADAKATIYGGDLSVDTSSESANSIGLYALNNAKIDVNLQNDANFSIVSTGSDGANKIASAIRGAGAGAEITINANNLTAEVQTETTYANAFTALNGAKVTVNVAPSGSLNLSTYQETSDKSSINVASNNSFTNVGLTSRTGSELNINAANINVTSIIDANSLQGTAAAVYAGWNNSKTTINGYDDRSNNFNFTSAATDISHAIVGTNQGTTSISTGNANDTVTINSTAKKDSATGLFAQAGGQVKLEGNEGHDVLNIHATFDGGVVAGNAEFLESPKGAYGLAAAWGGATNYIHGFEDITITAESTQGGYAYGMYTRDAYSNAAYNIIGAANEHNGSISVTITASSADASKAFAMYSFGGTNIIHGGSQAGDLTGDSITLNGHMVSNGYNGANIINTGEGNDIVQINGDMRGQWYTHTSINTGAGDDTINITGNVLAASTMGNQSVQINAGNGNNSVFIGNGITANVDGVKITSGSGDDNITIHGGITNNSVSTYGSLIDTGAGHDTVTIIGDITGTGKTFINTGEGNDVIRLHGTIGSGSLTLDAGDGYDTLVLEASSLAAFQEFYGAWLSANFTNMNIEAIHVTGMNQTDIAALHDYLVNDLAIHDTSMTYAYGNTIDLSHYQNDSHTSDINLSDVLSTIGHDSITEISLIGGLANSVTIDNLFTGTHNTITINGDNNDTVQLSSNWHQVDLQDGYYTFTNDEQTLLIQQSIIVNS